VDNCPEKKWSDTHKDMSVMAFNCGGGSTSLAAESNHGERTTVLLSAASLGFRTSQTEAWGHRAIQLSPQWPFYPSSRATIFASFAFARCFYSLAALISSNVHTCTPSLRNRQPFVCIHIFIKTIKKTPIQQFGN
jgi:hypothetical protein